MTLVKWIKEGEVIPFGLSICTGLFYSQEQWKPVIHQSFGKDGLVESVVHSIAPTGNPAGVWVSFILDLKFIRFKWRFKDWTQQIIFTCSTRCSTPKSFKDL